MDLEQQLRSLIATMLMLHPDHLKSETSLRSLDNSLSGTRLRIALKRLGVSINSQKIPATFSQLLSQVEGEVDHMPAPHQLTPLGISPPSQYLVSPNIGHDIQDVRSLPAPPDFWRDDFYVSSFSSIEIAYAVVKSEPREHLAGFWAAKEALLKCDAAFASSNFSLITVAHDEDGAPFFFFGTLQEGARLPHKLSISHAAGTASAVVIASG